MPSIGPLLCAVFGPGTRSNHRPHSMSPSTAPAAIAAHAAVMTLKATGLPNSAIAPVTRKYTAATMHIAPAQTTGRRRTSRSRQPAAPSASPRTTFDAASITVCPRSLRKPIVSPCLDAFTRLRRSADTCPGRPRELRAARKAVRAIRCLTSSDRQWPCTRPQPVTVSRQPTAQAGVRSPAICPAPPLKAISASATSARPGGGSSGCAGGAATTQSDSCVSWTRGGSKPMVSSGCGAGYGLSESGGMITSESPVRQRRTGRRIFTPVRRSRTRSVENRKQ